jgi:pyrroline-5-carboxylate reductase
MFSSPDQTRVASEVDSAEQEIAHLARRRRRLRLVRFMAAEAFALAILVLSVLAGISERFASESLTPIFRALPITAAAVAAILPILFFGGPKRKGLFK